MRLFALVLFLFCLQIPVFSQDIEDRDSTEVSDVTEAYTPDQWLVSEDEEEKGDQQVSNAPECDIRAVMGCYDNDRLRIDILLWNPVSFKWLTYFAIKLEYDAGVSEYYAYNTDTKKIRYIKYDNGETVDDYYLDEDGEGLDMGFVTSSYGKKNCSVGIIIDKEKHIGGKKGKRYYLTCEFESGFIDKKGNLKVADSTRSVNMYFVK